MRVGIDTRDRFLAKTGIRTVLDEIIKGLSNDPDIEVVKIEPKTFYPPKTKIGKIKEHIRFFFWKEFRLPILAKEKECDVLICNDYVVPFYMPKGIKAFPVFHGCNIWELPEHYNKYWRWMFTIMAIPAGRKASKIFTVSTFSKNRLTELFGFNPEKIIIVPLGPKRSLLEPKTLINLSKFRISENQKFLLHVGVMEKRKNLPRLIEAFSKLHDKSLKLVLVGQRGPKVFLDDYENIIRKIESLALSDRVILTGFVTDKELYTLYSKALAYIFPSLYEGFGIPVIEAFQFSLPVAASNRGALPEVLGKGGVLFDPKNIPDMVEKIELILQNASTNMDSIKNSQKEIIARYSWENTIKTIKQQLIR
ncbi:glycosyltransferase family 4 protein [Echinicola rosea]|uniref:Glycosyl transferase family 1 n=1 Tax=Echinicola rosea TaxID=1807691 RepID=A0ABQ1UW62_9BACT|nr:glycosyltransferase family 1 protein [Echinicola rosea]GGF27655.1 glycosyl transferase family 1 [Echinicola rosea]